MTNPKATAMALLKHNKAFILKALEVVAAAAAAWQLEDCALCAIWCLVYV